MMLEDDKPLKFSQQLSKEASEELRDVLQKAAPADPPKRVTLRREETFDTPAPSADPSAFATPGLEAAVRDVTVSETEKERFFEALLHDKCFSLDVPVFDGKSHVSIRSRNVYENRLCFEGVRRRAMAHKDDETSFDFVLWLQRFAVAIAVTHALGKDFSSLRFEASSTDALREEDLEAMEAFIREHLCDMAYAKWQVIVNAYMHFTAKEKLLLEGAINQDFYNPAG